MPSSQNKQDKNSHNGVIVSLIKNAKPILSSKRGIDLIMMIMGLTIVLNCRMLGYQMPNMVYLSFSAGIMLIIIGYWGAKTSEKSDNHPDPGQLNRKSGKNGFINTVVSKDSIPKNAGTENVQGDDVVKVEESVIVVYLTSDYFISKDKLLRVINAMLEEKETRYYLIVRISGIINDLRDRDWLFVHAKELPLNKIEFTFIIHSKGNFNRRIRIRNISGNEVEIFKKYLEIDGKIQSESNQRILNCQEWKRLKSGLRKKYLRVSGKRDLGETDFFNTTNVGSYCINDQLKKTSGASNDFPTNWNITAGWKGFFTEFPKCNEN